MKAKISTKIIAAVVALLSLVTVFASCKAPSADDIVYTVELPDTYHIEYEVKDKDGIITTVSKTVDENGSVYFQSGEEELLFIKDGNAYIEYVKNENDKFVRTEGKKVNAAYVDEATLEFLSYAEQSKNKYLPTAEEIGETEINGRSCIEYEVKVGMSAFNVSYSYYVDNETGICLCFDADMVLAGIELDTDDTVFTCVEFTTDGIEIPEV